MRLKKGLLPILCLMALTAGVTYAVVRYYVDVSMSLQIVGEYGLSVYEGDGVTPLTFIDFGELYRSDTGSVGLYHITNDGVDATYISYSLIGWPADVVTYVTIYESGGSPKFDLDPDEIAVDYMPPGTYFLFELHYDVDPNAVAATYAPTLRWNAND